MYKIKKENGKYVVYEEFETMPLAKAYSDELKHLRPKVKHLQSQLTEANKKIKQANQETEAQRKLANGLIGDFLKREAILNKKIEHLTAENENLKCCGNCKHYESHEIGNQEISIGCMLGHAIYDPYTICKEDNWTSDNLTKEERRV